VATDGLPLALHVQALLDHVMFVSPSGDAVPLEIAPQDLRSRTAPITFVHI
jgi:hypothetical protein